MVRATWPGKFTLVAYSVMSPTSSPNITQREFVTSALVVHPNTLYSDTEPPDHRYGSPSAKYTHQRNLAFSIVHNYFDIWHLKTWVHAKKVEVFQGITYSERAINILQECKPIVELLHMGLILIQLSNGSCIEQLSSHPNYQHPTWRRCTPAHMHDH